MSKYKVLFATAWIFGAAQSSYAATFGQDDHRLVIIESFRGDLASDASEPTINNAGTVLYYDRNRIPAIANPEYVTVDKAGVETSRLVPSDGRFLRGGVINDSGQIAAVIVASDSATADRTLVLIDPNGTVTELLRVSPTGSVGSTLNQIQDIRINASGEVAFSGRNADRRDVVGKVAAGVMPVILDQSIPGLSGRTVNSVDIRDDGTVVWYAANAGEPPEILASDGSSPPKVILSSNAPNRLSNQFAANSVGQVIGTISSGGPTVVLGNGIDQPLYDPKAFSQVQILPGNSSFVQGLDINDFGQVLVRNGEDGSIFLDGKRLIGAGDLLGIGELIPVARGGEPTRIVRAAALNNLGQVVFEAASSSRGSTPGTLEETETIVVRIDPRGATPDHAVLPVSSNAGVNMISLNLFNDLGITAPIYVDPPLANGLLYELAAGMPNFLSLNIPGQDLGGLELFNVKFEDVIVSLGFGEVLDFTSYFTGGVSRFSIFSDGPITEQASVNPFVAGLTFAGRGRIEFSITELAANNPTPVPLPAGGFLLLGGIAALAVLRHRRRNYQV